LAALFDKTAALRANKFSIANSRSEFASRRDVASTTTVRVHDTDDPSWGDR
jgi:hypothetical protein